MQRKAVWKKPDEKADVSRRTLREEKIKKRLTARLDTVKAKFQEGQRSAADLKALQSVQEQIDYLIEQMLNTKVMLAGYAIGFDRVYLDSSLTKPQVPVE